MDRLIGIISAVMLAYVVITDVYDRITEREPTPQVRIIRT